MMFSTGDCCPNQNSLIRVWLHEATRVYGDKLVSFEDIASYQKLVLEVMRKGIEEYSEDVVFAKPLIYFHYADSLNDSKYMPVSNWDKLSSVLQEAQLGYNELIGALNLVLFEDAMAHICRLISK